MSGDNVAKIIFSIIAIVSAFITVERLLGGDYTTAIWPALILAYTGFRLYQMMEKEGEGK